MRLVESTIDSLIIGVPVAGFAFSAKCIEWAFEAADEETSLILGSAGMVGTAFAITGLIGAIKIVRDCRQEDSRLQG